MEVRIDEARKDRTALQVDYLFAFPIITDAGDPLSKQGDVSFFNFSGEYVDDTGVAENDIRLFLSHGYWDDITDLHGAASSIFEQKKAVMGQELLL